jgi:hypothetical protein
VTAGEVEGALAAADGCGAAVEVAGALGAADGFGVAGFTCTSAAKTLPQVSSIAAKEKGIPRMTAYATQCTLFRKVNLASN